ncbi:MAG: carboxypeptidase regulatory-like domain-containing protein [Bryobacteraceae bacterium]
MFIRHSLLALYAARLLAQGAEAELSGHLVDPAGLPVAGAVLTLESPASGLVLQTRTGSGGGYSFPAVPAGGYRMKAARDGFAPIHRDVALRLGDHARIDLALALEGVTTAIPVTAETPLLETARGSAGWVVEQKSVVNLPLDGRNFVPLVALLPGVSLPPGSTLPRVNGGRPRVNEYLYDGASVLQPEPGQVPYFPVIDAIEEFRVETNSYSAEYGHANGGVVMVNLKSGANLFHGTLFEFFRNEALNARNFFAAGRSRPRFRRNQYGAAAGGPIRRNRTFFFADWQGTRLSTGVVRISTVPEAAARRGQFGNPVLDPATTRLEGGTYTRDPFPANRIPLARYDPVAARALDHFPLPNIAGARNNYIRAGNETTAQDQFDGRLDHYFSSRHRGFGRYTHLLDDSNPVTPLPDGGGAISSGLLGDTALRSAGLVAGHTWTPAADLVGQWRVGWSRRGFARASVRSLDLPAIPGVPDSAFPGVPPSFDIAGLQRLGPPANANADFSTSVLQVSGSLTVARGSNSLKLGADIRRQALDVLQPPNPAGVTQFTSILTGDSLASFLLGQVDRFQLDIQHEKLKPRANTAEFFVQEDRRVGSRLNLNLGVRYTLNYPSTVDGDRGAVFNVATERLDFLGRDGYPRSARNLEYTNFGPRVGMAFRASATLAIRAGYGLTWIEQAGITTPFTTPFFPFIRGITQTSLDNVFPTFVLAHGPTVDGEAAGPDSGLGQSVFAVQRDQKSGYAQQWNLTIQKTLGASWSAEAGYLGSKLTNLGVPDVNWNQLSADLFSLGAALSDSLPSPFSGDIPESSPLGAPTIARQQLLRPLPRFSAVAFYRNNVGHSTYHSLQTRLEKRYAGRVTLTAAYTFSKLIDDAGQVFDAAILTGPAASFQSADSHNRRLEKDVSTGDIRHVLSAGFVYELPGGWRLAGMARAQSGLPFAITQQPNFNAFAGFGVQRPNRIASPRIADPTPARWFDTGAFAQAAPLTIGDSSRNPVRGPGYRKLDLMASKTFTLAELARLEFRAEAFNLTNTPSFANPNGVFGTPGFGTITQAFDPRVFELVCKLHF